VAEELGEVLNLEMVYLIPAATPPHKDRKPITSFHHRLSMIQLATDDSPALEAFDLEGRRQGLSYSIDTLKEFHKLFTSKLELFFILGTDAFLEIKTWEAYRRLFDYANFVVIKRPGVESEELGPFLDSLQVGFNKGDQRNTFTNPSGNILIYKEVTFMDISSTKIREMIATGKSIRFLVPESVRRYILEEGLYKINGDS